MITYDKKTDYTLVSEGNNNGYTLAHPESYSCFVITIHKRIIFKRETLKDKHYKPNLFSDIRAFFMISFFNLIHNENEKINWNGSKNVHLYSKTGLFPIFLKLYFLTLIIRSL